jgi:hypothetical protein
MHYLLSHYFKNFIAPKLEQNEKIILTFQWK